VRRAARLGCEERKYLLEGATAHAVFVIVSLPLSLAAAPVFVAQTIFRWEAHASGIAAVAPLWLALAAGASRTRPHPG